MIRVKELRKRLNIKMIVIESKGLIICRGYVKARLVEGLLKFY